MPFALAVDAIEAGYRLQSFDTVGSTNALALDHARAGDPGRLWFAALAQTSGRGRRGRPWASPHGNLAATLLLRVGEPRLAATLGFVAGVALGDALDAVLPRSRVRLGLDGATATRGGSVTLKWPNDVLADGGKLAGILLESCSLPPEPSPPAHAHGGTLAVAIGIGVNVVAFPDDIPYPATSLAALGAESDAPALFRALSAAWTRRCAEWNEGRGLQAIRRAWLARAAGLGCEIVVRGENGVRRGIFEAIDEDCRLILREQGGTLSFVTAGEVHFGAVATAGAA